MSHSHQSDPLLPGISMMQERLLVPILVTLLGVVLLTPRVASADARRGQLLYENHCTACHESVVHVREDRKATSLAGIRKQVVRWSSELELEWGPEEIGSVVEFLNTRYYGFGKVRKQ